MNATPTQFEALRTDVEARLDRWPDRELREAVEVLARRDRTGDVALELAWLARSRRQLADSIGTTRVDLRESLDSLAEDEARMDDWLLRIRDARIGTIESMCRLIEAMAEMVATVDARISRIL